MSFVLVIRVLPGMCGRSGKRLKFIVPVDLAGPCTLSVEPGESGQGHYIRIIAEDGEPREWFAAELISLRFTGQ